MPTHGSLPENVIRCKRDIPSNISDRRPLCPKENRLIRQTLPSRPDGINPFILCRSLLPAPFPNRNSPNWDAKSAQQER